MSVDQTHSCRENTPPFPESLGWNDPTLYLLSRSLISRVSGHPTRLNTCNLGCRSRKYSGDDTSVSVFRFLVVEATLCRDFIRTQPGYLNDCVDSSRYSRHPVLHLNRGRQKGGHTPVVSVNASENTVQALSRQFRHMPLSYLEKQSMKEYVFLNFLNCFHLYTAPTPRFLNYLRYVRSDIPVCLDA